MRAMRFRLVPILSEVFVFLFFFGTPPTAYADTFQLQFTLNNFDVNTTFTPPVDPISGTIIFDKSPVNFSVLSLISIDLTIGGHSYSVPPVTSFNGINNGITFQFVASPNSGIGTDSFAVVWNYTTGAATNMFYTVPSGPTIFESNTAPVFSFTPVGTVPLPAALPLFATGFVGLALLGWRRKRKALA